ncbi:hypothetical protein TL16_g03583 [Triparma laevis f. inornata]|uniref:Aminotransferase class I/classII large domain-containing protein n=2 Tax=Triparma laevis TaxID=1534972 RepID=A0A9W7KWE9_9STRA|nr:hypothetical protein TL16_g03583 [Triparma laevis f. inornata]GMI13745.1 hypothetical protein TrLO_g2473 [Triparma laevis f. longispina]
MSTTAPSWALRFAAKIGSRIESNLHRRLTSSDGALVDFASNDYLGLCHSPISRGTASGGSIGSTGSRLLSGNTDAHEELEALFTETFVGGAGGKSALLFNSGYDANLSLLSSIPTAGDAIIADSECHNSTFMGARMSRCGVFRTFRHNDAEDLGRVIDEVEVGDGGGIIVPVEGYYSMSGTVSPLEEILEVVVEKGTERGCPIGVVLDEAHSSGVWGGGLGMVAELGLSKRQLSGILASVHTFGKAYGSHGAVVVDYAGLGEGGEGGGPTAMIDYLINYARPLIYSTSLPPNHLMELRRNIEFVYSEEGERRRRKLFVNVAHFKQCMKGAFGNGLVGGGVGGFGDEVSTPGPIQSILAPDSKTCIELARRMREEGGFDVFAIRPPTVPEGEERIRVVMHYHNSFEEIEGLVEKARGFAEDL